MAWALDPLYEQGHEVEMDQGEDVGMEIGQVAKLTGIPADTLRTWERRYGLVSPARDASGRRKYSAGDADLLIQIGRLVAQGERPSVLAGLSVSELEDRARMLGRPATSTTLRVTVAVHHPVVRDSTDLVQAWGQLGLQVVSGGRAQVVLVDRSELVGSLDAALKTLTEMHQPEQIVLTCAFLNRIERHVARSWGVQVEQGPLGIEALQRVIFACAEVVHSGVERSSEGASPGGRYTRSELESIINSDPSLVCECPRHLASLAFSLGEFESYSTRCAVSSAEDSILHKKVAQKTGQARAIIEELLTAVFEHEGLQHT